MVIDEYVSVGEAAEMLGLSTSTIRNYGKNGKLKTYRHPCNNYRLFLLSEIEGLLQPLTDQVENRET